MKQHIEASLQEAHAALTALLANPAGLASVAQGPHERLVEPTFGVRLG